MDIEELKRLIQKEFAEKTFESLEDAQRSVNALMNRQNETGVADFEGLSPKQMHAVLHFPFSGEGPLVLKKATSTDLCAVPLLTQVKILLRIIHGMGELKLTPKGFLPVKVVARLYNEGPMKDRYIDRGISKLYKETDSIAVNLPRILSELAGLVKKRNGKLSLTQKAQALWHDDQELLRVILMTFILKFNWAFYDGYGENGIGQVGAVFSLILLLKYGNRRRPAEFYAEKYFRAYPQLLKNIQGDEFISAQTRAYNCYTVRTFERFLDFLGVIRIDREQAGYREHLFITKTALLDKMFRLDHADALGN